MPNRSRCGPSMGEPVNLTIEFLNAAHGEDAARILSQAFNNDAGETRKFVDEVMVEENRIHGRIATMVAMVNGKLAGVIAARKPRDKNPDNIYALTDLAVDPAFGGRGIGHKLLAAAETFISGEWLKGQFGYARLWDYTKRAKPDSHFYEDAGYVPDQNTDGLPQGDPILIKPLNEDAFPLAEPDKLAP
ncbi:MAG TPA: GNAT family N-acetyltransferase [Patescibacteria group bacterium]|nr:GNAT family N-acetyltransferase [Patescibacteria group bacterium]